MGLPSMRGFPFEKATEGDQGRRQKEAKGERRNRRRQKETDEGDRRRQKETEGDKRMRGFCQGLHSVRGPSL